MINRIAHLLDADTEAKVESLIERKKKLRHREVIHHVP
jgi:hypothetical protein